MNKNIKYIIASISLSAFLFGCTVGPNYTQPETKAPDAWKSADGTMPNAAQDTQSVIEQSWWRNFNDPVLLQLIDKALTGNYDLKIAEARIAEARADRSSATAALWPTGDAKFNATREANQLAVPGASAFPGITNPFNMFQTGFDASWELDLFGGNKRAEEAATYELQASEASLADARVSLLAEVARTYVDIRQYQAQLAVAQEMVKADRNTVSITKQRADAGTAPGIDVTQAEAQLEQAQSQIPTYQSQLTQAEYSLDVLLGEQPGATHALTAAKGPVPVSDKKLVLAAPAAIINNRPDIQVAERKLASATAQQGVAAAKFYPDISLSGFLGLLNTHIEDLAQTASKSWLMGSSVVWPILSYGRLEANQELADAKQQEALATYQKTVLTAFSDVEKSVTAYTQQEKYRQALMKAVAKNRHASVIAKQRYKEGMTSFIEALDADRTLYTSEIQLAQADADTTQNLIAVYKSLGGGWQAAAKPTK